MNNTKGQLYWLEQLPFCIKCYNNNTFKTLEN